MGFWIIAAFAVVAAAGVALLATWQEFVGEQGMSLVGSLEFGAEGKPGVGLLVSLGAVAVGLALLIVLAIVSIRRRRGAHNGERP